MSSSGDDDDKFLYGSDEESKPSDRKRALETKEEEPDKRIKSDEANVGRQDSQSSETDNSESDAAESDSDSDVEFIISTGADTTRLDSVSAPGSQASGAVQPSGISVATVSPEVAEQIPEGNSVPASDLAADQPAATGGTLDLNAEGTFDGEPVTSLDPEVLREKPWRQPGANLSDYFNYGFNEYTWMEYLNKQEKLRQEYNPHKILMGLMSLQQNGKLNGSTGMEGGMDVGGPNVGGAGRGMAPPGFPPLPMFGGFSPFGMPGMMMNQGQKK
ncbi:FIP1 (YJR093C) [Zygosaccharomyces parabailii]|uniref:Pre-mRNA polyadenylation factor FIP1 n=1 Tax=Zygosaccharomyces bailii (strain CLIB 213 / ATCC 58445 / CBS 680 / BCRC 21525 / NBRC 1098 / NCYC 1416 / NRRL Y-2227) TaxID=1333698 RepID=A0A8J2T8F6_ZYGB2|nr:FIP1 (YJR093C) [Zygosaccharomyces parabailii]CDF90264.1 ZYBA0S06-04522g1_1 [Zygosaccharomyces bailii CLIB 213]